MKLRKTEAGQAAFKARSALMSQRQRPAFILFDGQKSLDQVLALVTGLGVTPMDIHNLVEQGFLAVVSSDAAPAQQSGAPGGESPAINTAHQFTRGKALAIKAVMDLGLPGFLLFQNLENVQTLAQLQDLMPKIRAAVGPQVGAAIDQVLGG